MSKENYKFETKYVGPAYDNHQKKFTEFIIYLIYITFIIPYNFSWSFRAQK